MTIVGALSAWGMAFAFTQIVEVPIYARALDGRYGVGFGASAITHPIVWFVFPWAFARYVPIDDFWVRYWAMVAAAEAFAVIVEAGWLAAFGLRRALLWSLAANGASFGLGLLSRRIFGYP